MMNYVKSPETTKYVKELREERTDRELIKELGLSSATFYKRLRTGAWKPLEIKYIKLLKRCYKMKKN